MGRNASGGFGGFKGLMGGLFRQSIIDAGAKALQTKQERREFEILLARGENPGTPRKTAQRTTARETPSPRSGARTSLFGTQAGVTTRKLGGGT